MNDSFFIAVEEIGNLGRGHNGLVLAAGVLFLTLVIFIGCGLASRRLLLKKGYNEDMFWMGYLVSPLLLLASCLIRPRKGHGRD